MNKGDVRTDMGAPQQLVLHVPTVKEMWFTRALQEDPDTMSYNAGWGLACDGYHEDTGCIDFPPEQWQRKHDRLVGHEPMCFYAFAQEQQSGRFVCEVNFHYSADDNWHDMGVLVYAPDRGRGYGRQALALLLHHAFVVCGIDRLHNDFEDTRAAALAIHRQVGFREVGEHTLLRFGKPVRVVDLLLTREEYLAAHPDARE